MEPVCSGSDRTPGLARPRPGKRSWSAHRHFHLAAQVAAQLSAHGWPIRKTGNFTGRIVATTAYYAPGERAAAERLAREFSQIRRVEPRFRGLPGTGLTLVVTRDWSS